MSRCAILTIGTELTRGDLQDQNGFWLSAELAELGHDVGEIRAIDDDVEAIARALVELGTQYDLLIATGGLGPTSDDLTASAAALATRTRLSRDQRSLDRLTSVFQRAGIPMHPMNAKQADFPEGAQVLDNDVGTAPGFACTIGSARAYFTPGVPREMQHLFEDRIRALLPTPKDRLYVQRFTVFGLPESTVAGRIESLERSFPIVLGYRAGSHEIEVKVQGRAAEGESDSVASARVREACAEAMRLLGDALVTPGRVRLAEFFGAALRNRRLTVGFAESCTGGLLSHLVTSVPGSSEYFLGGITSYGNSVKQGLLGVPEAILQDFGAVSPECALAMARGAERALGADLNLAITGIAGPGGGSPDKPVGLVHFAAVCGKTVLAKTATLRGDRAQIQRRAATQALVLGLELLRDSAQ